MAGDQAPDRQGRSPSGSHAESSPVEQAIAAAEQTVRMVTMQGTFDATGRPFAVSVPDDLSWQETCALVAAVAGMPGQLAARRGPQLVLPSPIIRRQ